MITKNGLLRPSRNSSLITSPKSKTKPSKTEPNEPDIDFSNIPTIQGTYKASKVNDTSQSKVNSTQDAIKMQLDNNNTKGLPHTQTTKFDVEKTTEPSLSAVQTTLRIKGKVNDTKHDEAVNETVPKSTKKVPTSTVPATQTEIEDLFKDFRKPDFETSPWRPIIPGYVNPELKLLPDTEKTNYKVNYSNANVGEGGSDSVRISQDSVQARIPESSTQHSSESGTESSYVDVPGMSAFDMEDTDFPHDRIVPQEMVNFRVNGKFKNKIPGILEDGEVFTEPSVIKTDESRPDIEVSGQLPPETYDIRLRTSSQPEKLDSSSMKPSSKENETGWVVSNTGSKGPDLTKGNKKNVSNAREKESSNFLPSVSSTRKWQRPYSEESTTMAPRIGIAEPVPDTDIELEPRNRYSDIQAVEKHHGNTLQDRKVDKNGQEPVYTSYKTPDLNGAGMRPSLIENSGTLKPFRHTIPVDKITAVLNNEKSDKEANTMTESTANGEEGAKVQSDANLKSKRNDLRRNETDISTEASPENRKEIVEVETFVGPGNDTKAKIELELARPTEAIQGLIDDEKLLKLSTTEVYSEMIHPLHNNVDKLVMQNETKSPGRLTPNVSRNSTFIEIDTLKHTPGQVEAADSSGNKPFDTEEGDWSNTTVNRPSLETQKKIYNDTLKAYVVENLVTLAPAKSNTGVGRPVRPRPKIDKEKTKVESSNRSSPDDTTLLEQLFGVQNRDRNTSDRQDYFAFREPNESSNGGHARIEQIVEVVTSISTKVSSSVKEDPVVLKLMVTNSTSLPVIHAETHEETSTQVPVEETPIGVKEENRAFGDHPKLESSKIEALTEIPSTLTDAQKIQTSDRKISTLEENRFLLEKLRQLAEIGSDDKPVKSNKNTSRPGTLQSSIPVQLEPRPSVDFDKLKEIADIATGNETLMNSSAGYTMTRDGVEIFTKILNKVEDRTDKMISSTEKNKETGKLFGIVFNKYML